MIKKLTKNKIIIISCILMLIIGTFICIMLLNGKSKASNNGTTSYEALQRRTKITHDGSSLQITRNSLSDEPLVSNGSWTILMYICGSDLESIFKCATQDIEEIMAAKWKDSNVSNLNFIIQTGGSNAWHTSEVDPNKIQRFKVTGDKLELLETLDYETSSNPDTLYNFLEWGVTNYPAEKMATILWDHGDGPIGGTFIDEKDPESRLSVNQLEYCLEKLSTKMTSKFEFIGFDTCLSGSIEYASILAPYTKYMIASAQVEPASGWTYTPIINQILKSPDTTGEALGEIICDEYKKANKKNGDHKKITMATYNLSKIDPVLQEIDKMSKHISETIKREHYKGSALIKTVGTKHAYGKYKELTDIGSIMETVTKPYTFSYDTTALNDALKEFICYAQVGKLFKAQGAVGLSIFFPRGSGPLYSTLQHYRNVCFSPYYQSLIDKVAYANLDYDFASYTEYDWTSTPYFYEETLDFLNVNINIFPEDKLHESLMGTKYASAGFLETWYNNIGIQSPVHPDSHPFLENLRRINPLFETNEEEMGKDIKYTLTLDEETVEGVYDVYNSVFYKDGDSLVCLGENNKVNFDTKTGKVSATINKEWYILPDGQHLTTYFDSYYEDDETNSKSTVYAIPVVINEIEATIKIEETITAEGNCEYTCLGIWDSNNNSSYEGRGFIPLEVGTTITPVYDVYNETDNEWYVEYGEEYTITSDFDFLLSNLPKGEYVFSFALDTKFTNHTYSEFKEFVVE